MKTNNFTKELCSSSSLCSCDLLARMHQNFLKKFKLHQNQQINDGIEFCKTANVKSILSMSPSSHKSSTLTTSNPELLTDIDCYSHNISSGNENEDANITNKSKENFDEIESIDYEILDGESRTPVPIFEMMSESELNGELAKYGHGPMGKRAAIKLLNQIFEATHPVLSQSTPIPRKLARLFNIETNLKADIYRQKRTRAKIACLIEPTNFAHLNDNDEAKTKNNLLDPNIEKENRLGYPDITSISHIFIEWLRDPQNEELYNDVLLLNPIFFDKIYPPFKKDTKDIVRISKECFAEMLDKLGITHCSRNALEDQ